MGNNNSCCAADSPPANSRRYQYEAKGSKEFGHINNAAILREDTSNNLQHISEREPDTEVDPSIHPSAKPTFMERSQSEMKLKERGSRKTHYVLLDNESTSTPVPLAKSNSCSTIYVDDSTISQPNLKNTIKCISLAIYYHISNRKNLGQERLMEIFEERLHPITKEAIPVELSSRDPEHRQIYRFIRTLFHAAQLTAECAIVTLVYIERLLCFAEIDLCPSNWRRVVLGAIMLASKVWDDQAVWNVDYCQILRDCAVEDMNELERQFLESLEFNINVPSSVYASYYFNLRTLALANDLQLPLMPLHKERAKKLEALSRDAEERMSEGVSGQRRPRRRWNSAENCGPAVGRRSTVVIS